MAESRLILGDSFTILPTLADESIDLVLTDPPYGILTTYWDKPIDIGVFMQESYRLLKPTGFLAFFGMMPSVEKWLGKAREAGFAFSEHIIWVKRNCTPGGNEFRLKRGHESIFVYGKQSGNRYHQIVGPFEDVKLPGVLYDTITMEAIQRHIADLKLIAKRGYGSIRHSKGKTSPEYAKWKSGQPIWQDECNFTNVWSFLPPASAKRDGTINHPTEKPIEIMKRLMEMLTPPEGTILDPFMGSGPSGMAAKTLKRNFIGIEIDPSFYATAEKRIQSMPELLLGLEDI